MATIFGFDVKPPMYVYDLLSRICLLVGSKFLKVWIDASNGSAGCLSLGDQSPARMALRTTDTTNWISLPGNPAILLSRGHTAIPWVRFIPFVFASVSVRYRLPSIFSNSRQAPSTFSLLFDNVFTRVAISIPSIQLTMNYLIGSKQMLEPVK